MSALTDLELVNNALIMVGESRLTTLDNTVNSAKVQTVNEFLPRVKRAVLRSHDWNTARKRAAPALLGTQNSNDSLGEWLFAYRLPPDYVAFRQFIGVGDEVRFAPFSVELDSENKHILYTDLSATAKIVYTAEVDSSRYDPLLFDTMSTRLAIDLASTFSRDSKFVQGLWASYKEKLDEAMGMNYVEGGVQRAYDRSIISVRQGTS